MKRNRIIILGAGFSRPAGLPTGDEIFPGIYNRVQREFGNENHFNKALENFINFKKRCDGIVLNRFDINFEEFLSYLDIEYVLGLKGSDTWSSDGNLAQIITKRMIGKLIHEQTPNSSNIPDVYLKFAEYLQPNDYIITFNYDILLERALEAVGKPYRLFPNRFKEIRKYSSTIDNSKEEVVVLKMHGSVDWFSKETYNQLEKDRKERGVDLKPRHQIFKNSKIYKPENILSGVRRKDDPLIHMYRICEADKFYSASYYPSETPWLLSPSYSKILYANKLKDFWWGLGQAGGWNLGLGIIGFSIPEHDEYIRQVIYKIVTNYQEFYWDDEFIDTLKSNVKIIDKREDSEGKKEFKERYSFVDWSKSKLYLEGFNKKTVEKFFEHER